MDESNINTCKKDLKKTKYWASSSTSQRWERKLVESAWKFTLISAMCARLCWNVYYTCLVIKHLLDYYTVFSDTVKSEEEFTSECGYWNQQDNCIGNRNSLRYFTLTHISMHPYAHIHIYVCKSVCNLQLNIIGVTSNHFFIIDRGGEHFCLFSIFRY